MRRLGAVLAATALAACAADRSTGVADQRSAKVPAAIAGMYGLTSVNGRALPQNFGVGTLGAVDLLSGSIQLNDDATYLDILTIRRRGSGGIQVWSDTVRGGYVHFAGTVMLTAVSGDVSFYDLDKNGYLVSSIPGFWLVYKR